VKSVPKTTGNLETEGRPAYRQGIEFSLIIRPDQGKTTKTAPCVLRALAVQKTNWD